MRDSAAGRPRECRPAAAAPYSPELNPVERAWLYLRERFLFRRVLADYKAAPDAACDAWNARAGETGRLASLTAYPWLLKSGLPRAGTLV